MVRCGTKIRKNKTWNARRS